jgi:hypothetical protein
MTDQLSALPEINHLISAIADEAEAAAPSEWDRLTVQVEFGVDGSGLAHGEAYLGDEELLCPIGFDALDRFEEIRKAFVDAGQPLWKTATVTVTQEGDVDIDFTYESSELTS